MAPRNVKSRNAKRTAPRRGTPRRGGLRGEPAARRAPQQERGERRVEELLDAAERVIAEVGVEAATTNAIAAAAGAGMGSLYHFFPNKEAIVVALADRYHRAMRPLTEYAGRPDLAGMPPAAKAEQIVEPLAEFFRRAPAYRHVFHATNAPGSECHSDLQKSVVDHVEALMAESAPHTDPGTRRVHAMVAVEFVHGLLGLAFGSPPDQRDAIVAETKRLLALYAEMITKGDDPLARPG